MAPFSSGVPIIVCKAVSPVPDKGLSSCVRGACLRFRQYTMKARITIATTAAAPNTLPTMTPVFIDFDDEPLVDEDCDVDDEADDEDAADAVIVTLLVEEDPGDSTWR